MNKKDDCTCALRHRKVRRFQALSISCVGLIIWPAIVLAILAGCSSDDSDSSASTAQCNYSQSKDSLSENSSKTTPEKYSAQTPMTGAFSLQAALNAVDMAASNWSLTNKPRCVSCHTNGPYLTLPAKFRNNIIGWEEIYQAAQKYVKSWEERLPANVHEVVAAACFLAIADGQTGQGLHPGTVKALDQALALQDETGHWPKWGKCHWYPSESDDHYGVTLMAVALGMVGDEYAKTPQAVKGITRIKNYLNTHPPALFHHKAMLLWAAEFHEGIVKQSQRELWIEELFSLQRADGGWFSADLGPYEQIQDAGANPPAKAQSDGYGTGFTIYILRLGGVPATDIRIEKGVTWLKNNQRSAGYWWTHSIRNYPGTPHYIVNTGTVFAIKALALCAENMK